MSHLDVPDFSEKCCWLVGLELLLGQLSTAGDLHSRSARWCMGVVTGDSSSISRSSSLSVGDQADTVFIRNFPMTETTSLAGELRWQIYDVIFHLLVNSIQTP